MDPTGLSPFIFFSDITIPFPYTIPYSGSIPIPGGLYPPLIIAPNIDPSLYPQPMLKEGDTGDSIDWTNPPSDPSGLGPDWEDMTDPNNDSSNKNFKNKKTGEEIRWDTGVGRSQKPHWHRENPNATGKKDAYLDKYGNPVPRGSKPSHIYPKSGFEQFLDSIIEFFTPPEKDTTWDIPMT